LGEVVEYEGGSYWILEVHEERKKQIQNKEGEEEEKRWKEDE